MRIIRDDTGFVFGWFAASLSTFLLGYLISVSYIDNINFGLSVANTFILAVGLMFNWPYEKYVGISALEEKEKSLNGTRITINCADNGEEVLVGVNVMEESTSVVDYFKSKIFLSDTRSSFENLKNGQLLNFIAGIALCFYYSRPNPNQEFDFGSILPILINILIFWIPLILLRSRNFTS